ncbi:MAG: TIGR03960 family B12-binding radical SAM protein [bacterium]
MIDHITSQFLPSVEKPERYLGQEMGLPELPVRPDLRVVLAFPDLYELGMSYLGLRILYHLANQVEGVACERVFMPWFDAVKRLRELELPLFTLETKTPLHEVDLIGFNLQYELHTTNILAMLDLGKIPLRAENRTTDDPIVIAGGPLAHNPEPYAPFFDAIVIGDGEIVWPELLDALKTHKKAGLTRSEIIRRLVDMRGLYIPSLYRPSFDGEGKYSGLTRSDGTVPRTIEARITPQLRQDYYPRQPIVPTLETTHHRVVVEIARGCSCGCRFCSAGMIYRPVRERPVADLLRQADQELSRTGFDDLSLLSLSTADYRYLEPLLEGLEPILLKHRARLSFPSLRPQMFTSQIADRAAAQRKSGLTFAPEAATARLRKVINKHTSNEDLLNACQLAFERGWQLVKLYFMVGLPTETEADVEAIVDLVKQVDAVGKGSHHWNINVSLSPFSPKPQTPFQYDGLLPPEEIRRRYDILKNGLKRYRRIRLDLRRPEITMVETAVVRGGRKTADALEARYRQGAIFDAWTDGFYYRGWIDAFSAAGLDLAGECDALPQKSALPWDHIDSGVSSAFLDQERNIATLQGQTSDCRQDECHNCGLQTHDDLPCPDVLDLPVEMPHFEPASQEPEEYNRYIMQYRRTKESRFYTHHGVTAAIERALKRLAIPLEYKKGFHPRVRLVSCPPLNLGFMSECELVEFGVGVTWTEDLTEKLAEALPQGIVPDKLYPGQKRQNSIGALNSFLFHITPPDDIVIAAQIEPRIVELLDSSECMIERQNPKKTVIYDARPGIWRLTVEDGAIFMGVETTGGKIPRVDDLLKHLYPENNAADHPFANWDIVRIGQWWVDQGVRQAPLMADIATGENH